MGAVGNVDARSGDDDEFADGDDDYADEKAPEACGKGYAACAEGVEEHAERDHGEGAKAFGVFGDEELEGDDHYPICGGD